MVSHDQAVDGDFADRYVSDRLDPAERLAFEEHFFACDECFRDVLRTEEIAAGLRKLTDAGKLRTADEEAASFWQVWRRPVVWLPMTASLFVVLAAGGMAIGERRELATERAQSAVMAEARRTSDATLEAIRQRQSDADRQLARLLAPEADVPVAVLESTRGPETTTRLAVPAGVSRFVLWAAVPPDPPFGTYRLSVRGAANRDVASVDGLHRNERGAVAVSLPSAEVPAGRYVVRLDGMNHVQATLVGEYVLEIR